MTKGKKLTEKKPSQKAAKKPKRKPVTIPEKQGNSEAGYGNPPEERQFKPGQSGNPNGPPKHRTQLWTYFCWYMALTDAELAKLDRKTLTQAQQTALKLVENAKKGKYTGSEHLARHVFDREEGKAVEHLVIENENTLTDEECEEIRKELLNGVSHPQRESHAVD
jgi:hypothetical protein